MRDWRLASLLVLGVPLLGTLALAMSWYHSYPTFRSAFHYFVVGDDFLGDHPAVQMATWEALRASELDSKYVVSPNDEVLDYLYWLNHTNGYREYPRLPQDVEAATELMIDVEDFLAGDPFLKKVLGSKLIGIVAVENLGSSGLTISISGDRSIGGYWMAIDVGRLHDRSLSEWRSLVENSAFQEGWPKVEVTYEGPLSQAFVGILLHEIGHVLQDESQLLPHWKRRTEDLDMADYAFARLSWVKDGDELRPRRDPFASLPHDPVFYAGERKGLLLPREFLAPVHRNIEASSFASVYGALTVDEDFAEFFAEYVLARRYGVVKLTKLQFEDGRSVSLLPCLGQQRCAVKEELFDRAFSSTVGLRSYGH